nr:hypothetical protein [Tanacetum cinerariifolium]
VPFVLAMINLLQFLVMEIWFKETSRSTGFITSKASITISSRLVNFVMQIWRLQSGNLLVLLEIFRKTIYSLNGNVERQNRTLVEAAQTMLSASKLSLFFWAKAITTACYTQNKSIIILTNEKTTYHIVNDRKPSIRHLYIFGCTYYLTRDAENLDNMKEKEDPCILVGYSTQSKGYHVYNKNTRLIVESMHIKFDEIKEMTETFVVVNNTSGLVLE